MTHKRRFAPPLCGEFAAFALFCCLFLLLCCPSLSSPAPVSSASDGSPAAPRAAAPRRQLEFDPDEIEGLPDDMDGVEIMLDDDGDEELPPPQSIWEEPAGEKASVTVPERAFDPERVAQSLDWVWLHMEVRRAPDEGQDEEEGIRASLIPPLHSTRKMGREAWKVQLGSGIDASLVALDQALRGARIGDKKEVQLRWSEELKQASPTMPDSVTGQLHEGEALRYSVELIRFDLDTKELTLEDRFWNMLPMFAFFGFMAVRIMRPGMPAAQEEEQAAGGSRPAGGRRQAKSASKKR